MAPISKESTRAWRSSLLGGARRSLGSNVRAKIAHPYVLFYEHNADTVTVLRVLHGHRHITADLLGSSRG
jgi:plasmid stabilization system protein ParE